MRKKPSQKKPVDNWNLLWSVPMPVINWRNVRPVARRARRERRARRAGAPSAGILTIPCFRAEA